MSRPASIRHYRFTVEDYFRMGEVGILDEDDRVELLEGEIVETDPVGKIPEFKYCGVRVEPAETRVESAQYGVAAEVRELADAAGD